MLRLSFEFPNSNSNLDSTYRARATRNVTSTDRRDAATMSAADGAPSEYSTAEREGGKGEGSAAGRTAGPQGAAATLHVENALHVTKCVTRYTLHVAKNVSKHALM